MLAVLAVVTMSLGDLVAIVQNNIKRMLASSSIAHAGYLLLGVLTLISPAADGHLALSRNIGESAASAVLFYLLGPA